MDYIMNENEALEKKQMEVMLSNIDSLIMMCDNPSQLLMLASAMLSSAKLIYETTIGPVNSKKIITEMINDKHKKN